MMNEFADGDALAAALAERIAIILTQRIEAAGAAALAVSGGSTPVKLFQALAAKPLDWTKISLTLVDDRWVPETSTRSNARLVRQHLLQGPAAAAIFLPLVTAHGTPEAGREAVDAAVAKLPLPFAAVVLGIGTDGHTASLFPDGDRLESALAPAHGELVEAMRSNAADEPRITLTLPVLMAADHVFIHIEGETKRHVLAAALRHGPIEDMPIRAFLINDPPAQIFWCP